MKAIRPTSLVCLVALAVTAIATIPAHATTFDITTLHANGSGSSLKYYTGLNGTGTYVMNYRGYQQNPWTLGTGSSQASINFSIPGQGNNGSMMYPTIGDYNYGNYSMYFAFSNPTYDNNCGFNCNTDTGVAVSMNSLDLMYLSLGQSITITGYSNVQGTGAGPLNSIDTMTVVGTGAANQLVNLNWAGIEEVAMTGNGYYVNDITVNSPCISATPEPSSLILLGTGLTGLAGLIRRRLCM